MVSLWFVHDTGLTMMIEIIKKKREESWRKANFRDFMENE